MTQRRFNNYAYLVICTACGGSEVMGADGRVFCQLTVRLQQFDVSQIRALPEMRFNHMLRIKITNYSVDEL